MGLNHTCRRLFYASVKGFYACEFLKKMKNTQAAVKACVFAWKNLKKKERTPPFSGSAYGRSLIVLTAHQRKKKKFLECSFDADGIAKGVDWINERYESELPRWKKVSRL